MIYQENKVKEKFHEHMVDHTLKHISIIINLGVLFLMYYMYSDLMVRNSQEAFYARFVVVVTGVPLFVFHLFTKDKYKNIKFAWYHVLLTSGTVMMYLICLIHLRTNALAPSVTGAILIIFLISLEVKAKVINTVIIYFLPVLLFTLSLVFYFKPTSEQFTIMADIYPILIVGFVINRVQYKLRYKLFKSNYLLDLEKQKTDELYHETLAINDDLKKKTDQIIEQKEEIVEKNQKLQESNATKDKFLTIISHDLIGPFNILSGFSDILKDSFQEQEDIEEQRKYADYIHQNIQKTYKLLENLLIWARSQKDGLVFQPEKINLYLFCRDIVDLLNESAWKKSIAIENRISKEMIVDADRNMLSTILRNLISNAIKFTPQKGKVTIDAKQIQDQRSDSYIEISVQDTGMGIAPQLMSKLFHISENISTKGTEKEEGTGLGLILCKEFVEKHGGEIHVESEPDKGSNFKFTLPAIG